MKAQLDKNFLALLETECINKTEAYYGRNDQGFYNWALNGFDLIIQGTGYYSNKDQLTPGKDYPDFKTAIRSMGGLHFHRVAYTFKAAYDLLIRGYYLESAILLRAIVESYVKLRYINKRKSIDLVHQSGSGHFGYREKKFNISYQKMFDKIAPGMYKTYQLLCEFAHGNYGAFWLKTNITEEGLEGLSNYRLDVGVEFKENVSQMLVNQYCVYLLAHLEFMMWLFPEIKHNMSIRYTQLYHHLTGILWSCVKEDPKFTEGQNTWRRNATQLAIIDDSDISNESKV